MKQNVSNCTKENLNKTIEFNTYTFEDFSEKVSPDKNFINMYYKLNPIYKFQDSNKGTIEEYYTSKGIFHYELTNECEKVMFLKAEDIKYQQNLEAETAKKISLLPVSKRNTNCYSYRVLEENYYKKTKMTHLRINNHFVKPADDDRNVQYEILQRNCHALRFSMPYLHAKNVLSNIIKEINRYAISRRLNVDTLENLKQQLSICDFSCFSYSLLEDFLNNPEKANLADLIYKFAYYKENISRIIEINTKDTDLELN